MSDMTECGSRIRVGQCALLSTRLLEAPMTIKDRIGIDLGRRIKLEDGIEWAAKNQVR